MSARIAGGSIALPQRTCSKPVNLTITQNVSLAYLAGDYRGMALYLEDDPNGIYAGQLDHIRQTWSREGTLNRYEVGRGNIQVGIPARGSVDMRR